MKRPRTLGALRATGYSSRSVRSELRANLIARLRAGDNVFPGVVGFDRTVVPQIHNAILSGHDFVLLGLRGQAKTRLLRALPALLDEAVPYVAGTTLREDPLQPITAATRARIEREGDDLAIDWLEREERYHEKLATPDVSIADLVGDVDPIKAATLKRALDDPEVIHYGLLPRSNRGLFAINELPDLQPRIQVALFNVLEEGDLQIRGFPLRLPLDVLLLFSANPEDYTNRGNIITPLRDRIASQILTHYPRSIAESLAITEQEAWTARGDEFDVQLPEWLAETIERVAFRARESELVDANSGVSARMTIALRENVVSNAERRALLAGSTQAVARVADMFTALPAITGKIELVYEGEREGPQKVAQKLIGEALGEVFQARFASALEPRTEGGEDNDIAPIVAWFSSRNTIDIEDDLADDALLERLKDVPALRTVAEQALTPKAPGELAAAMEFVLEGLAEAGLVSKSERVSGATFRDSFEDLIKGFSA
ncbi:MAG: magnesium chelatase [Planctomycetota bacterium]